MNVYETASRLNVYSFKMLARQSLLLPVWKNDVCRINKPGCQSKKQGVFKQPKLINTPLALWVLG